MTKGLAPKKKKRKLQLQTQLALVFPSLLAGLNYRSNIHLTSIRKDTLDVMVGGSIYPA